MAGRIGVVAVLGFLVAAATQAQAMPLLSFADIAPACKASTGTEVAPNSVSAQASGSCEATNGTACSPNGSQRECVTSDNLVSSCICFRSWSCTL
jgi:hypothetical protein